ncbi:1958_t:CDS:2, partial [Funneliformis geosporum]
VETYTPLGRYAHSTILVGNKLYIFSGVANGDSNEVDISKQFNAENPPWTDLTLNSGIGFKIYEFNLKLGQWIMHVMKGNVPARRREIQAVADNFGNIYSYGPIVNAPTPYTDYTATLLLDGVIIYIGGRENIDGILVLAV